MSKRRAGRHQAIKDGIFAALAERRAAIRTGSSVSSLTVRAIDAELKLLRGLLREPVLPLGPTKAENERRIDRAAKKRASRNKAAKKRGRKTIEHPRGEW